MVENGNEGRLVENVTKKRVFLKQCQFFDIKKREEKHITYLIYKYMLVLNVLIG
jgi:hypothetical protein